MILGQVDDYRRPLIPLVIRHPTTGKGVSVDALIDTVFSGSLLLTPTHVNALGLQRSSMVSAGLADGSSVVLETFHCQVEWLGKRKTIEAVGGSGSYVLIGSGLLEECTLFIHYPTRQLSVSITSA